MKRQFFTLLAGLLCLSGSVAQAAKVDTLSVRSNAMNKNVTVLTVRPDKAVGGEKCPVIYLLHGHGGNAFTWMTIKPDLPQIADREGIIFVCPDGKNSWYWDSPRNKDYRYESFVAKELVEYIDKNFATKADRSGRVITGLSMGGHGGMCIQINFAIKRLTTQPHFESNCPTKQHFCSIYAPNTTHNMTLRESLFPHADIPGG